MANISKTLNVSQPRMLSGKLMMFLLILLIGCIFSRPTIAETSVYVFGSDQSTVVKTGGFAGVHETYAVTGQFQLAVDSDAGVAFYETVDANLADETGAEYGRNLEEIFNMTGLDGIFINKTTIDFKGKTDDGTESDVRLMLSFMDGLAHLTGKTTPPPNSADMFIYDVNAVATKKYEGGTGEPNDPYLIDTAEQLNTIGAEPNDWDKHFKLMADIDLSGYSYERAVIAPDTNDVNGGFQGTAFNGVFDGNGHTISHLTIEGDSYLGLFGRLEYGGAISNLGLETVDVNGTGNDVGCLAGRNSGRITSCYSTGTASGDWSWSIGGLVGDNDGMISNCHSTGAVSGQNHIGGLVGFNYDGMITSSYSTGSVKGLFRTSVNDNAGGLVGENYWGTISNCYSNSSVSGNLSAGGLVGVNGGTISNCYSTGAVSSQSHVGGLVGWGSVTSSFWDIEASGQSSSDGGIGKTTSEMQIASTFLEAGWDFVDEIENGTEDVWSICEGTNYPRFVWQIPVGDFVCPDGITIDDFMFFMEHWLDDNCDLSNGYCEGTDLDQSGTVDEDDLEIFFENWQAEN